MLPPLGSGVWPAMRIRLRTSQDSPDSNTGVVGNLGYAELRVEFADRNFAHDGFIVSQHLPGARVPEFFANGVDAENLPDFNPRPLAPIDRNHAFILVQNLDWENHVSDLTCGPPGAVLGCVLIEVTCSLRIASPGDGHISPVGMEGVIHRLEKSPTCCTVKLNPHHQTHSLRFLGT